jgi:hypothetical protein
MNPDLHALGLRFDIGKIASGYYGSDCWKVFWRAVMPEEIKGAFLFEGDTAATLSGSENVFCIAVQSRDSGLVAKVREMLANNEEFMRVCATPPFVEGGDCISEPLPEAGQIDDSANLVGRAGTSRSALGAVRRERSPDQIGPQASPPPPREKPASDRTRDLPSLTAFSALKSFIESTFRPKECEYGYWVTPQELCDIVEAYADLIEVHFSTYSCPVSEDLCSVKLYEKEPPGLRPMEFIGLFPFPSLQDALEFGQEYRSNPAYAKALPSLAGVHGKYHMNFGQGSGNSRSSADDEKDQIAPESLWTKLHARWERFAEEQAREEEAAQQRADDGRRRQEEAEQPRSEEQRPRRESDAQRRAEQARKKKLREERRSNQLCVMCGQPLGFIARIRKQERHKGCFTFIE